MVVKNPPANAGRHKRLGLTTGLGISLEEGTEPTPGSCLMNPVDRGAWWATVHRVHRDEHNWKGLAYKHIHVHTQMYTCNIYMQFPAAIIKKLTSITLHYFKNHNQFALRTFFIYFCRRVLIILRFPRWLSGKESACQCKRQ